MSVLNVIKHALDIVEGLLIPGASASPTNLTHTLQAELAKVYGATAADLARNLAVNTTSMSGPEKVSAITAAIVATAQKDGFEGDLKVLGGDALDVAQAACAIEPYTGDHVLRSRFSE